MTNWLKDDRGNKCSVEYFGTNVAAQTALDSLENCDNCINCSRCSGCSDCSGCSWQPSDDEAYALFLILDTLARSFHGKYDTVNHFRDKLLLVYRDWHAANPGKVHPPLALSSTHDEGTRDRLNDPYVVPASASHEPR